MIPCMSALWVYVDERDWFMQIRDTNSRQRGHVRAFCFLEILCVSAHLFVTVVPLDNKLFALTSEMCEWHLMTWRQSISFVYWIAHYSDFANLLCFLKLFGDILTWRTFFLLRNCITRLVDQFQAFLFPRGKITLIRTRDFKIGITLYIYIYIYIYICG